MASFIAIGATVLLAVTAILQFTRKRQLGCWLLVAFPALLCAVALVDMARGPAALGQVAFESDTKQLMCCAALLGLTLLAAWRARWKWMFWVAWMMNALICGILVYLVFFWKVFG